MSDPDTVVVFCETPDNIIRAINALTPQLPDDVGRRLGYIKLRYWQLFGFDGLHERVNNRTVSTILREFEASGENPRPVARGQIGDTRFELFEAPQDKNANEESAG